MQTFSFRLQKVLDFRHAHADQLGAELASLERSRELAEGRLADLQSAECLMLSELRMRAKEPLNIPDVIQAARRLDSLRGEIADQASVVRRIGEHVDAMRSDLLEVVNSARALDRMRDRQTEEHLQAARRQDRAEEGETTAFQRHRARVGD